MNKGWQRRALSFTLADWAVLAEAWFELLWVGTALAVLPFSWCQRTLEKATTPATGDRASVDWSMLLRLQRLASRHHLRTLLCLPNAIVLNRMLRRRGVPSTLVIGAKRGEDFAAHAWVEVDGLPIGEGLEEGYVVFGNLAAAVKEARRS